MSTYTDASLIITPNAKKAGKLYALKGADLDAVRATTATYVGSDGLNKTALANEVRFDYTNGSCPSILVEPQRTNLVLRSEEFDNATWNKTRATISTNTTISPTGNLTADTFNLSNVGQNIYSLSQTGITSSSLTNTFSIYVKYTNRRYIQLTWFSVFSTNFANFDLITGTITGGTYLDAKINNSYDGFFRISITSTGDSINAFPYILSIDTFNAPRASTSDGIGSYILFGAQIEAGSNATSYIPTVASTVTRNADVISKTGISSLIGQTEGTLFVDVNYEAESVSKNYLNLGTSTLNYIAIGARTNNKIGMEVLNSGVQVNATSTNTYSTNQRLKIAMTYKLNDFKLYVNGVLQATDTSGTVPAKAEVYLGSYGNATLQATDGINSAILWKTALTDQECIALTTL